MSHPRVVTRFAPSPTGFLHIGGARTALFSSYFARRHGGEFRLRIEDTDKARSTAEATQAILDGLDWLDVPHDGNIVYQSENADRHRAAAEALIVSGHAFPCYMTEEEIAEEREKSRAEGRAFRSSWRDGGTPPEDRDFVVRFRVPEGKTVIRDHVQGEVTWDNKDFDDLILLRTDGSPVYMLAVVVDDHDMGVTHVVRGDDHLVNAGRQKLIYQALGWDVPDFAHVPLIFGPDGKKLSKRHGALGVEAYRDMGYLPDGLRNYLTRLGWSHGDMEVFTDEEITDIFELADINKAPARLDFDKMAWINGQHMHKAPLDVLLNYGRKFFEERNEGPLDPEQCARLKRAIPAVLERAKTLIELADKTRFAVLSRPLEISGKAKKPLKPEAENTLRDLLYRFEQVTVDAWHEVNLLQILQDYIAEKDIGFGKVGAPLRACLTAGYPAPDLTTTLDVLGKPEALGRIEDALNTHYKTPQTQDE